jgi:hypothetical protein
MALRTVRLDEEAEKTLRDVVKRTGLSISGALTRGLFELRDRLASGTGSAPYEIYAALDLGRGGYASAPSTETRRGVREAIRRKLRRRQ